MAITIDATSSKDAGNVTSSTLSHTCTGASMLIVVVAADSAASPTGITYNGVAMTKEVTQAGLDTTVWSLANPASGANNIIVTFAASHYFGFGGISLIGTETSSYTDGTATGSGTTNDAAVSVTTGTANSLIVMAVAHNRNSSRTAIASSTIRVDQFITTDNFTCLGITRSTTTAGSYSIGETMGTPSDGWYGAAVAIKQAQPISSINTSDSISIAENLSILVGQVTFSVSTSDQISISESLTVRNTQLGGISVSESLSITESVTMIKIPNTLNGYSLMRATEGTFGMDEVTNSEMRSNEGTMGMDDLTIL